MLPSFGCCGLIFSTLLAASLPVAHGLPNPAALANPAILHDYSIKPRQVDTTDLPIINLGYAKHQAQSLQTIGNVSYYVFKNVRFAAPPLGERRFRVPAPPLKEEGVQNGVFPGSTACAQGLVAQGVAGQPGISLPIPGLDQLTIGSEDCLVSG